MNFQEPESAKFYMMLSDKQLEQIIFTTIEKYKESKIEKERLREPELLSTDEVVKLLKVSKPTLWHWHNRGILTHKKIGKRNQYLKEDVYKYMGRA
jgi:hypothetical protein